MFDSIPEEAPVRTERFTKETGKSFLERDLWYTVEPSLFEEDTNWIEDVPYSFKFEHGVCLLDSANNITAREIEKGDPNYAIVIHFRQSVYMTKELVQIAGALCKAGLIEEVSQQDISDFQGCTYFFATREDFDKNVAKVAFAIAYAQKLDSLKARSS